MKPFILLVLCMASLAAPRASALPPSSRTLKGEIAQVEREHQRFTVRTVQTPSGFSLAWGPRTQFFRDGKLIPNTALARGQQVTARYRVPFFGPRIASEVFILPGTK